MPSTRGGTRPRMPNRSRSASGKPVPWKSGERSKRPGTERNIQAEHPRRALLNTGSWRMSTPRSMWPGSTKARPKLPSKRRVGAPEGAATVVPLALAAAPTASFCSLSDSASAGAAATASKAGMAESDVRCKARAVRSMHEKGPPTNGAGTQRLRVTTRSTQQASEGCATPGAFFVLPPSAPRCATSARAKEVIRSSWSCEVRTLCPLRVLHGA